MTKLQQPVRIEMSINNPQAPYNPTNRMEELTGTNHTNLRSKITGWIDLKLIQYNVMDGATILIAISPAEKDEWSRLDPE